MSDESKTASPEAISGRWDRPPWCPHTDECRNIAHSPVEFDHNNESGFCVGEMSEPRTTIVPYDPLNPEHRNTHWMCLHGPTSGTDESQITPGDMALLAEVLLVGLKDSQGGALNWEYFKRVVSHWQPGG